jgi:hypothetical protein
MPTLTRLLPTRHCPCCGDERAFETPPCADGHGLDCDCAELACRDCGAALLVNPPAPMPRATRSALGAAA